jgi:hypothetical protein
MKYFDMYITLIFFVKIIFIILAVYIFYLQAKKPQDVTLLKKMKDWKEKFEFMFVTLMSVLLVYIFYPKADRIGMIDKETKLLLFLFGIVLLLTEHWINFIDKTFLKNMKFKI